MKNKFTDTACHAPTLSIESTQELSGVCVNIKGGNSNGARHLIMNKSSPEPLVDYRGTERTHIAQMSVYRTSSGAFTWNAYSTYTAMKRRRKIELVIFVRADPKWLTEWTPEY